MHDVVTHWSTAGFLARVSLLVATGVAWTAISLQSVLLHPDYWDPVTLSDWLSIWGYSTTWVLTAASLLVFREIAHGDGLMPGATALVAGACLVTGLANALEDALDVGGMGSAYVAGILSACVGMLVLAAMTWAGATRRLAFAPLSGGIAAFTMVLGGGPIALVAWAGLAVMLVRARSTAPKAA